MDNCAAMHYPAYRIFKEGKTVAKIGLQPVAASARTINFPDADRETFGRSLVKIGLAQLPAPNLPPPTGHVTIPIFWKKRT